jgi:hypothetical protein
MSEVTKKLMKMDEFEVSQLYKNIFGTPGGVLVLEDLKNRCFIKTSTAHELTHVTYQNEGMRTVALHIQTQIDMKPEESENV